MLPQVCYALCAAHKKQFNAIIATAFVIVAFSEGARPAFTTRVAIGNSGADDVPVFDDLLSSRFPTSGAAGGSGDFDVDVVYTWVKEPKRGTSDYDEIEATCGFKRDADNAGNGIHRYRNSGIFNFSLLSVQMYLPWVRNVFVVTSDGTLPDCISNDNLLRSIRSKTIGVSHAQIWPEQKRPSELPTHNSNAIETHLHRIPGLAEHFLYLNDDMFIGREVPRSEFFNDDGSVVYHDTQKLDVENMNMSDFKGVDAIKGEMWNVFHQAQAYRKSAMEALQEAFPEDFSTLSSQRCRPRNRPMAVVPLWFLTFFQVHTGAARAVPVTGPVDSIGTWIFGPDEGNATRVERWCSDQLRNRPIRFCIEDNWSQDAGIYAKQLARIQEFLLVYFVTSPRQAAEASMYHAAEATGSLLMREMASW